MSFDITGTYLCTDIGAIAIDTPSAPNTVMEDLERRTPQYKGVGLSANGEWVTWNSANVAWLPSEYQPWCSAVSGKTISIGVASEKV